MPSSMAHLTNGANRTLMRATIVSFMLQPQFQVQFLLLPLDGQDHHYLDKNKDGHLRTLADHRIVG